MGKRITIKTIFKFKRGNAATWTKLNSLLEDGEPGFELDTGRLKIGDGKTLWNDLKYFGGEAKISADGQSIEIVDDGTFSIYGFSYAEIGQIPSKGEDGKIKWVAQGAAELDVMTEAEIREICK